jgi:DNA-binding LacI/PurR family transcriptional regulator
VPSSHRPTPPSPAASHDSPALAERRVTGRTVAAAAGVSVFTVSQAMAGRAGVAPATRERVLKIAARLGYQPDPAASRLVARRRNGDGKSHRLVVAALAPVDQTNLQRLKPRLDACAAKLALDFRLHPVPWGSSPSAILRVLWQQGVQGIALCPSLEMEKPGWREADWSRFSVFKSTRSMPNLPFHLVRHGAWDYMQTTLAAIIERGYRRVAVLLHESVSRNDNLARLGAVLVAKERLFPVGTVCQWREYSALYGPDKTVAKTVAWLRNYGPDVLVVPYRSAYERLVTAGFSVPRDFAVACVLSGPEPAKVPRSPVLVSGCDTREPELYEVCLHQLREMILNGERGFPAHPFEHVISPRWIEGDTLPALTPAPPAPPVPRPKI